MELELSVQVFVRDKHKGLSLTEVGQEIALLGRQMTAIEQKIYEIADQENNLMRGKVKIGCFPAVSKNILPEAFAEFKKKYPHVSIELHEGTSNQIKEWISERIIDVGIVASPFDEFDSITLTDDYMVAVFPHAHELNRQHTIRLSDYQDEFIFCKGGHETSMLDVFGKEGIDFKENLTVQTVDSLISMVENGLGIGIVSKFTLSSVSHNLSIKAVSPNIKRNIGLIALAFEEISPATHAFVNLFDKTTKL